MERKEFIQLFGLGAAAVLATGCLGGCSGSKDDNPAPAPGQGGPTGSTGVDFTLDLTEPANAALNDPQKGYVYGANSAVIVARLTDGSYIAVQAPCTHEGTTLVFQASSSMFRCPNHGSLFNPNGTVANGPAERALKKYTVTQTGNTLRVTS
ncbi:QcrA and Rieske domain-containing protein [Hymenobacter cellulosilyticus]|uniref:Rieske (2Fe-2S) protein n=1 Tax=Hymenobacter cellulosilyticus TaxID=2932248 RepID=A0A8T9Q9R3_9BACT|nr:Rieske (2Fe-2S) protein [Hymenobacter cellulosilyticus]UOQ73875.1 Rieske (2Fe-2S) protein [Hymenobacter cellulosilyticus]